MTFSSVAELDWVRTNVVVRRSKYEERIWVGASDLTKEGTWKSGGKVVSVKTVINILFKMDIRRVGAFPLLESWRAK